MKKRGVGLILGLVLFAILDELLGVLIPDKVLNVAFAVVATVLLIGLVLVVHGTYARNRWGVNFFNKSTAHAARRPFHECVNLNRVAKCSGVGQLATNAVVRWTSGVIQSLSERNPWMCSAVGWGGAPGFMVSHPFGGETAERMGHGTVKSQRSRRKNLR